MILLGEQVIHLMREIIVVSNYKWRMWIYLSLYTMLWMMIVSENVSHNGCSFSDFTIGICVNLVGKEAIIF